MSWLDTALHRVIKLIFDWVVQDKTFKNAIFCFQYVMTFAYMAFAYMHLHWLWIILIRDEFNYSLLHVTVLHNDPGDFKCSSSR